MPDEIPVIKPEAAFMVAIPVALLDHVPPPIASESGVEPPTHSVDGPVIGATGFTVSVTMVLQPVAPV